MSEEFLITEELILEFLDPLTAKSYAWTVEETLPPQTRFQASFLDDKGKKYFISFRREPSLGKNSRQIHLSVQKNKITTFKINIDRGSFLKILGTLVQVYSHYKEETADGKMTGSYAFIFPDSFAKYMKFVARVTKRLFKTAPKLRLELVGALESDEGKTVMFYTNPASVYPYFGGKYFDDKHIKGDFYESLGGKDAETDIQTQTNVVPTQVQSTPKVNFVPDGVEPPLFHPENSNFGGSKSSVIQMKQDSGSSSLKKGDYAHIVGLYSNSQVKDILKQYNIPLNDTSKFNAKGIMIVKPSGKDKYVALPAHTTNNNDPKNHFDFLDQAMNKIPEPVVPQEELKPQIPNFISDDTAAKNPNAKDILVNQWDLQELAEESFKDIEVGPIKISLTGGSVIEITEKVKKVSQYFGAMSTSQATNMVREVRYRIDSAISKYITSVNKVLREEDAFLKFDYSNPEHKNQQNSISMYTGSDYGPINEYLRKGDSVFTHLHVQSYRKKIVGHVSNIDQAFAEHGVRLPESLTVYRGASISGDDIKALQADKSIGLSGYASVSLKPSVAESFSNISGTDLSRGGASLFIQQTQPTNSDPLPQTSMSSRQGNKILYNINRLDRCLSLMLKDVSGHSTEEEILLNRGTKINQTMLVKVLDRDEGDQQVTDNDGIWFCKAKISHKSLSEGIKGFRSYLLKEDTASELSTLDEVSILDFVLADIEERLGE